MSNNISSSQSTESHNVNNQPDQELTPGWGIDDALHAPRTILRAQERLQKRLDLVAVGFLAHPDICFNWDNHWRVNSILPTILEMIQNLIYYARRQSSQARLNQLAQLMRKWQNQILTRSYSPPLLRHMHWKTSFLFILPVHAWT